jgi:hypothetical protein
VDVLRYILLNEPGEVRHVTSGVHRPRDLAVFLGLWESFGGLWESSNQRTRARATHPKREPLGVSPRCAQVAFLPPESLALTAVLGVIEASRQPPCGPAIGAVSATGAFQGSVRILRSRASAARAAGCNSRENLPLEEPVRVPFSPAESRAHPIVLVRPGFLGDEGPYEKADYQGKRGRQTPAPSEIHGIHLGRHDQAPFAHSFCKYAKQLWSLTATCVHGSTGQILQEGL